MLKEKKGKKAKAMLKALLPRSIFFKGEKITASEAGDLFLKIQMQISQHGVRGEHRNCSYTAANFTCTALLTMKTHRS